MSVLTLGGQPFAAGLFWLDRAGTAGVAREARGFRRPWYVHWGRQTGYAPGGEDVRGCPALAASLQVHLRPASWMALVEADDGRLALVKARDGAILADGDEVFEDRAEALEAFERARPLGWKPFATPGLTDESVGSVEITDLPVDPAMCLSAAPLARLTGRTVGAAALLLLATIGAGALWLSREAVWTWIAGPEPVVETVAGAVEPTMSVAVDSAALIEACRRARTAHPPWLPGWRTERVSCEARFRDQSLLALRPELADRAVMLVRWRLSPDRSEALNRRVAEEHLAGWYAGSVDSGRAWALVPLAPVLRLSEAAPPSFLEFRREIDRRLGTGGARIAYAPPDRVRREDGAEVRIETDRPLVRLAEPVGAVPGLEIMRLTRAADDRWHLEGRRVSPAEMPRSAFEELKRRLNDDPTAPVS